MISFLELIQQLKREFSSGNWKGTLILYLNSLTQEEVQFALQILSDEKRISVSIKELKENISSYLNIPVWMIEECKKRFGTYSHTFTLLFPEPKEIITLGLLEWKKQFLDPMEQIHSSKDRKEKLSYIWNLLPDKERNLFHRLILKGKNTILPEEIVVYCKNLSEEISTKGFQNESQNFDISIEQKERTSVKLTLGYAKRSQNVSHKYEELSFFARTEDNGWIKTTSLSTWELNEEDSEKLSEFIKNNQIQKFGPVFSLRFELVCEISFTKLEPAKRNKSGIKLVSPRLEKILWKEDISHSEDLSFFQELLQKESFEIRCQTT
ncbi:hypothetical protein [Leptospira idonii]|uniref:Uncharacterized protein n=1 Tax=Leptospira idonii TaxID=1193500 RepID=A0A4R9LWM6_9LEPT|nr:hypothetical protein [Leptospira idonii]TGN17887.1 hypothetical protein EHS15_16045 [Leptospira idonii]